MMATALLFGAHVLAIIGIALHHRWKHGPESDEPRVSGLRTLPPRSEHQASMRTGVNRSVSVSDNTSYAGSSGSDGGYSSCGSDGGSCI